MFKEGKDNTEKLLTRPSATAIYTAAATTDASKNIRKKDNINKKRRK